MLMVFFLSVKSVDFVKNLNTDTRQIWTGKHM